MPESNPFVGDPKVKDSIYALGVRNPQGLVFDPVSKIMYETEHGPMGGDEINRISSGKNYGWPTITYGDNYNTQKSGVATSFVGMEQPLFYYLPSIATSPIAVYNGKMFPEWSGHLLVGALRDSQVSKLNLLDGRVISEHRLLREFEGRVRDIKVGDDGSIWFLLQKGGVLYRLFRDPARLDLEKPELRKGVIVYKTICASCHSSGLKDVPQLGDSQEWRKRLGKDKNILQQNVIEGFGAMPPKGLCENCTDDELRAATDYMVRASRRGDKPPVSQP